MHLVRSSIRLKLPYFLVETQAQYGDKKFPSYHVFKSRHKCEKYLGLPILVGKSRSQAFKNIKDEVWNWLNNWNVKFLSQEGKRILLKAMIQAIPT